MPSICLMPKNNFDAKTNLMPSICLMPKNASMPSKLDAEKNFDVQFFNSENINTFAISTRCNSVAIILQSDFVLKGEIVTASPRLLRFVTSLRFASSLRFVCLSFTSLHRPGYRHFGVYEVY